MARLHQNGAALQACSMAGLLWNVVLLKMLQNVTKKTKKTKIPLPISRFEAAQKLSCFRCEEGLLETWNNANADLDMVQKGTIFC